MDTFFSIIIPVYNVAPYLRDCLDSVLTQTFTDWEAICVDDGSTDGSSEILDEYASKDSRFRVIHQGNKGVGAARNVGLDAVEGDWILFLDGDDVWNFGLLSIVEAMINANPTEKLFRFGFEGFESRCWKDDKKSLPLGNMAIIDISNEISTHDFQDYLFYCYAYARDLFDGIRFPRYIRGEDRCVLNHIQLECADAIISTDVRLYGYRQRMGSAVNSIPSAQVLRDEMDHRLDIMEMIDASHKKVVYAGNRWLEGYFTHTYPVISFGFTRSKRALRQAMNERLPRLLAVKGLSRRGRTLLLMANNPLMRPVIYLILPTIQLLRSRLAAIKPLACLYRRIMHHGEFSRPKGSIDG